MAETEAIPDGSIIPLAHMPQQIHAWKADDDWTGIVDRKERRKLQNRQNQRKWRQRRKATSDSSDSCHSLEPDSESTASGSALASASVIIKQEPEEEKLRCGHAPPNAHERLRQFEATLRESYLGGSPRVEHLIGLQRLNVHRAIRDNIHAIGMTVDWMACDDSISIFNLSYPHIGYVEANIPVSLRPTEIQRTVPHHPWLDFFPFPRMRDCLITAAHLFDDEELCHDLMAFWDTKNSGATLLVWGPPWDPRNWEVTEGFVRKWGWMLRGSSELLVSTNYWRRRRGEGLLDLKEILALK
ncbi:hypothetical protein BDW59DRAFT_130169 [Aspergillus cavernicola]|uniref:BZIP domain-containing protein n=1 Tax=Aspergillus cavernicola TaxID=176166 RepID=A0ABR4HQX4_9EURO